MFLENTLMTNEQFGWIEIICGSMFSGKTEELIRRLNRAKYAKQKIKVFKWKLEYTIATLNGIVFFGLIGVAIFGK